MDDIERGERLIAALDEARVTAAALYRYDHNADPTGSIQAGLMEAHREAMKRVTRAVRDCAL